MLNSSSRTAALIYLSALAPAASAEGQKAVLITGANCGFGGSAAENVSSTSHFVCAGTRSAAAE